MVKYCVMVLRCMRRRWAEYFEQVLNVADVREACINIRIWQLAFSLLLLASSRRLIFGGPVIALRLTGKSLSAIK